jgi:nucleotide-binding universal stress UspA family protein
VRVLTRLERAHAAGPAIVAEAEARNAEIIVLGSPRRHLTAGQSAVFGKTVDYVLKHASCRVLVTGAEPA